MDHMRVLRTVEEAVMDSMEEVGIKGRKIDVRWVWEKTPLRELAIMCRGESQVPVNQPRDGIGRLPLYSFWQNLWVYVDGRGPVKTVMTRAVRTSSQTPQWFDLELKLTESVAAKLDAERVKIGDNLSVGPGVLVGTRDLGYGISSKARDAMMARGYRLECTPEDLKPPCIIASGYWVKDLKNQ